MTKRQVKRRYERQYRLAITEIATRLIVSNRPVSIDQVRHYVEKVSDVPDHVIETALQRGFQSGVYVDFAPWGGAIWLKAPLTLFPDSKVSRELLNDTGVNIECPLNRRTWKEFWGKMRAIARPLGGHSFAPYPDDPPRLPG